MNKRTVRSGFSITEIVIVLVVLTFMGFLGWRFMDNRNDTIESDTKNSGQQDEVPMVKDRDDLKKTEEFLNDTDIDKSLDTSEIDAAIDP